ncbi:thioesterase family protein [Gymnodinialimonas sp. 57CJ19]|uniref:thioesterase family protein n=1 Tax=Gymnodinialimonas sp. 57CJ19 TaxID=3138498 RepID=UPI0031345F44
MRGWQIGTLNAWRRPPMGEYAALPASAGPVCWTGYVGPDDIDENGHMNVKSYDRIMENADMAFFYDMGWTPAYPQQEAKGYFRVEKHVRYQAELLEGTPICVTAWLAATDGKRFHLFFQLWNRSDGRRSATMETMLLHMDLTTRRPAPIPDNAQSRAWNALLETQKGVPVPEGLGRRVSMDRQD